METKAIKRIARVASIVGLAVDVAALVIVGFAWSGLSGPGAFAAITATTLMIATLALQLTFVIVQLFPNGRVMVPVRMFGPDAWEFVIVSTAIPGVLWHELAELAIPSMRLIMPGFTTPLFTCLLFLVGRLMQQRRMSASHQLET